MNTASETNFSVGPICLQTIHPHLFRDIQLLLSAYTSNGGGREMKDIIHIKNTFKSADPECLRKAVTAKVEKLVNNKLKSAG